MTNQPSNNNSNGTAQRAKTKIKKVIDRVRNSTLYKVAVVAAVTVGGLLALGGLYRVLAWTMQGWNQLSATFK